MKRAILTSITILVLIAELFAQANLKKLDQYFDKALHDWKVPGMAVAIVKDDKIVFEKGYGVRERVESEKVDEFTLFAIASNTKAFTAGALAVLVDQGKLSWNDRVQKYLPYFQLYDPYVSHDIRIRDLLCHRSGLGTYSGDLIWYGTPYSREEVVRRAKFLKQAFTFRSGYGYSNIMYIAAGEVLEKVSGQTWEDFIRQHFFRPMGMSRTLVSVHELDNHTNVAAPHGEWEGELMAFPWYSWDSAVPAGGIISCVHDMSQWLRLQINHGAFDKEEIFSDVQWRVMWTPHVSFVVGKTNETINPHTHFRGYGLGWGLYDYKGCKVASHSGAYDGMFSRTAIVPDLRLGMVILTNSMTDVSRALVYKILDAYMGDDSRDWSAEELKREKQSKERRLKRRAREDSLRVSDTQPSLPLARYTGIYGGDLYGDAEIKRENGKLVLVFLPNPDLTADMTHWHFDTFEIHWRKRFPWFGNGKVQFILDEKANVVEMKVNVPNDDFWFHELEFKKR